MFDDEIYLSSTTSSQSNQLCLIHLGANRTFCVVRRIKATILPTCKESNKQ